MPHTRSAKKSLRKNEKRRLHNRAAKKAIKTQIKKVLSAVKSGTVDDLRSEYNVAAMKLDKAAARHVIHPNLAGRKKSQLAKLIHQKQSSEQAALAGK